MKDEHRIRSLAAFFQERLHVLVTTATFYPAGCTQHPPATEPSALVTIQGFTVGGLRRLVLNRHSTLMQRAASLLFCGTDNSSAAKQQADLLRWGEALIRSATWIVPRLDGKAAMHWKVRPGLIATPQALCVWPVPHQPCGDGSNKDDDSNQLAVWPRRIAQLRIQAPRDGSPVDVKRDLQVTRVSEIWQQREKGLLIEFEALFPTRSSVVPTNLFRRIFRSTGKNNHDASQSLALKENHRLQLLTMAPALPIFAIAETMVDLGRASRINARGEAAQWLVQHDRLFGLSVFFGVPLLDRTGVLTCSLQTACIGSKPPSKVEVQDFLSDHSEWDLKKRETCHESLRQVLLERARQLWKEVEEQDILVAWSGGIDSTASLCALLETANNNQALQRLYVLMDEESILENPDFHRNVVIARKLQTVDRAGWPLSHHAHSWRGLLVTGELGDQMFGSDRCGAAFAETEKPKIPAHMARMAPEPSPEEASQIFVEKGLAAPWQDVILPVLSSLGLMAEGGTVAWTEWIAPQLEACPIQIQTTYDFLWWLNFSCKWQNVSLRCLHDGGSPSLLATATSVNNVTGCIRHFYQDRDLELWSCVPEFHARKFPNLSDWSTYKEPLKSFIRSFDGDDSYYRLKTKVPSLCFEAPTGPGAVTNHFYGAVVQIPCGSSFDGIVKGKPTILTWGACGMIFPEISVFRSLLHSNVLNSLLRYPSISKVEHCDPWTNPTWEKSPIELAPYFAEQDERQRRVRNPVSHVTLMAKCATLLTPEVLCGRTFLDLGACLGASSHWALCMGARKATVVEVQPNFCERAEDLLTRAEKEGLWPEDTTNSDRRFQVVQSDIRRYLAASSDSSHDVVLAAGVIHCFPDPLHILNEIARVSSQSVLIEMTHPLLYLEGNLDDEDYSELKSVGLSDSVRPRSNRLESAGLLQVAPQATVNMAGEDASYQGFALIPSRRTIESFMRSIGFTTTRVVLAPHPTIDEDIRTYTAPRKFQALSMRYFLRCDRTTPQSSTMPTLESAVMGKRKIDSLSWKKMNCWYHFSNASRNRSEMDQQMEALDDPSKEWEFNDSIAQRFDREAICHIPDYEDVVRDSIDLISREHDGALQSLSVVDVGCATGYTVLRLLQKGFPDVSGVDLSSSMLNEARKKLERHGFDKASRDNLYLSTSPTNLPNGIKFNLDAVIINWTLQFVRDPEERKLFLSNIGLRMVPGALLILTEKTDQCPETKEDYYRWKSSNGVSDREIATKEARLKGVLETLSLDWYLAALRDAGFCDVSIYRAKFGFVTFLARREGPKQGSLVAETVQDSAPNPSSQSVLILSLHRESEKPFSYETEEHDTAPFAFKAWAGPNNASMRQGFEDGTVYGYVHDGPATITRQFNGKEFSMTLIEGMYFACPGVVKIVGGSGVLSIVEGHQALFSVGGPLELGRPGRLPYIDGCSDSLLLSPTVKGAPCLNHLHFPAGIVQTHHTHPSGRTGMVVRGKGTCVHQSNGETRRVALQPGVVFVIPTNALHAFETTDGEDMDVVAFHPDSDFGPSFEDHPMVNRTMVNGIPATKLDSIRTRF